MFRAVPRGAAITIALALRCVAFAGEPLDATVSTTSGAELKLSSLRGRPTVMFYEDRDSTALNQPLKDELFKRGRDEGLLQKVTVIAIANVKGYDWFPARNFVVAAVKDTEKKVGVPVYLDWSGTLTATPWNLPPATASVLVLDREGRVALLLTGKLKPAGRDQVFSALKAELAR